MIDIHSHILPGIDDGSKDLATSIKMAKLAVADGTTIMVASPHFMPGMYDTKIETLFSAVKQLDQHLKSQEIPLKILSGGDIHLAPDLCQKLQNRIVPTISDTQYFLFEPPHHVLPPKLIEFTKQIMADGYTPVLTHPERLTWIEKHYDIICELDELGVPIQLTAKSVTGEFGKRPKYWSDRMLDEGRVDLIASDAHNATSRPPGLKKAFNVVEDRLGDAMVRAIFLENPVLLLKNKPLNAKLPRVKTIQKKTFKGFFSYFTRGG